MQGEENFSMVFLLPQTPLIRARINMKKVFDEVVFWYTFIKFGLRDKTEDLLFF